MGLKNSIKCAITFNYKELSKLTNAKYEIIVKEKAANCVIKSTDREFLIADNCTKCDCVDV